MGIGITELIIILVLVLFFLGGKRFPKIGEGLGKGISEFKRHIRSDAPPKPEASLIDDKKK